MITFWLICGLFVAIALAFVLPPLWQGGSGDEENEADSRQANVDIYRSQLSELKSDFQNGIISRQQYEQDRDEIERRLLEDVQAEHSPARGSGNVDVKEARSIAYLIAVLLPVLAVGMYLRVGYTNARPAPATEPPPASSDDAQSEGMSSAQIEANVAALAKRLEANPGDAVGWTMLARSYSTLGKHDEAVKAYEKAVALKPDDVDLLTNYAFALATAHGGNFDGQPNELIQKALRLDPNNVNALGLAGGIAYERKDYRAAVKYWDKVMAKLPPDSELARSVNERLTRAKSLLAAESSPQR